MSHCGELTDGVPVKIPERYCWAPAPQLPPSVETCEARARAVLAEAEEIGPRPEQSVLDKVRELRAAKQARCHRRQLRLEARIATRVREDEAKNRSQLSVSRVCYPVETPLLPTPAFSGHLLDEPALDPLRDLRSSHSYKIPQFYNVDSLTFSDFENDTSSPFDNVELKTINDMEQLAEVLRDQNPRVTPPLPVVPVIPPEEGRSVQDIIQELSAQIDALTMPPASPPPPELPPGLQEVCDRVSRMGFPVERVKQVCSVVGDNDKKVVEGLLLLEELLELGFSESKVCAALALTHCDRDQTLDHLVA